MKRVSPLLNKQTEVLNLDLAPDPWKIVKCLETGFVYLENPPGYEALEEEFSWDKTWENLAETKKIAEPIRYRFSQIFKNFRHNYLKRDKIRDILLKEISKRRNQSSIFLLDVGCGAGNALASYISDTSLECQNKCIPNGIEISKSLSKEAASKYKKGKWENNNAVDGMLNFENDQIDIILLSSFLEHEIDPVALLKNSFLKLKKGGSIIIKVPNFNSWNRYIRKDKWCGFRHPDHVNYFTKKTLKAVSLISGFKNVSMNFLDSQPLSDSMYAVLQK